MFIFSYFHLVDPVCAYGMYNKILSYPFGVLLPLTDTERTCLNNITGELPPQTCGIIPSAT